jgi:threonine-phosphate decarboxylase
MAEEDQINLEKAIHGGDVWAFFPVIDFSSNVNPLGPPRKVLRAVRHSLWMVSYYPDDRGTELRKAIAERTGAEEGSLIIGNGSTEIIKTFAEAFIDKGDRVVIPYPTYSEYRYQALVRGAEVELIGPGNDFSFVPDAIAEALETGPRALFLCDPNNPTGRSLGEKALRRLVEDAWENQVLVLLDEAYVEFSTRPPFKRPWEYDNLLVSRSLTKLYALPGLRLGYGVAGEKITAQMERLRMPWNVNVLAQVAGVEALRDWGFVKETLNFLAKERKYIQNGLSELGLVPMPTETNFFLVGLEGRISSPELKKRLLSRGILVRDCSSFEALGENYIRVSVKRREENRRLISELEGLMERLYDGL